ncbi:MAG: glycosyltransferase [Parcubacteria group bacterium]
MNILFTANAYFPAISGVAISTQNFRNGLERLGERVWLITPRYPGYTEQDPHIIRIKSIPNPKYPEYPIALFRASSGLRRRLRAKQIELVHTMQPFSVGRFAKKIARDLRVPLIFTYHARYDLYAHYVPLLPRKLAQHLVVNSVHRFANTCDAIIAPSASIKAYLRTGGIRRPIYVVPTGLARSCKLNIPKAILRKSLGLAQDKLLLLCVTRVAIQDKNLLTLLRAYQQVRTKLPNCQLILVGGGPDLKRLKLQAQSMGLSGAITFVGFVPNRDVPQYYSAADIFVYPSISETQGIITIEALSAGLPVVAPQAPGNSDFVEHGRSGYLTANSPASLAEHVLILAQDPELRQRFGQHGQRASANLTEENSARRLRAVYQEVLATR